MKDLNKLSSQEDIQKLRFNIEKYKVLYFGSKDIDIEFKWRQRKKGKLNEECDLGVDFDDIFKSDKHILSLVLRTNWMICWMVRNFILGVANVVLKIYKTLIAPHIE